jgi:hypothetical protein
MIVLSLFKFAPIARADGWSGNTVQEWCEKSAEFCSGYVSGIADIMTRKAPLSGWLACIPAGVSTSQLRDIFVRFLQDHPAKRHLSAASLAAKSLAEAFPCH